MSAHLVSRRAMLGAGCGFAASIMLGSSVRAQDKQLRVFWWGSQERADRTNKAVDAFRAANAGIDRITTKALPVETVAAAWKNLTFTADPIASSLQKSKDDAVAAGLLDEVDLHGIYDLSILNRVLAERGLPQVEGL